MCLWIPVQFFVAWSMVANLPNNGVSIYLQNSISKGYLFELVFWVWYWCLVENFSVAAFRFRD